MKECPDCDGYGVINGDTPGGDLGCGTCDGTGKIRTGDGRCEKTVFDPELKATMKRDGEQHDGMRRCDNKATQYTQSKWLCTYHFHQNNKAISQGD